MAKASDPEKEPKETTPLLSRVGAWHGHRHDLQRRARPLVPALLYTLIFYIISVSALYSGLRILRRYRSHHGDEAPGLCLSSECVHASSAILYNLSPNYKELDPCTEFEELVCGGWRLRNDLRPDQGDAFVGTQMAEASQQLLRHILEAPYPGSSDHSEFSPMQLASSRRPDDEANFAKMKSVYDACSDLDTLRGAGAVPLKRFLGGIFEACEECANRQAAASSHAIEFLAKNGVPSLVSIYTTPDDKDPDTIIVTLSAPRRPGLPSKERYDDEDLVEKYRNVVHEVLSRLYPQDESAELWNRASEVVDFEKKLAKASPTTEYLEDVTKTYNPMSLSEAADLAPSLGLSGIVAALAPHGHDPSHIIVTSPSYVKEVQGIVEETSTTVLQSYFRWKAIQAFADLVEADEVKPYKQFTNILAGKPANAEPERWRTCVGQTDNGLGWILSRFFIEKAFSAEAKSFGDQIILDIKDEFVKKIRASEWMEEVSREKAVEKVRNLVQKIGYPTTSPDVMDPGALRQYYEGVEVSPTTHFGNVLSMRRLEISKMWEALGKPTDRGVWEMTVPTVNAYYNPPLNEIVFPAGIMQFPVFDVRYPKYLSYGAFGSVSGHELSHAFDSTGRHYDMHGNYTDWWTEKTVEEFEKRAQCFVDQYSNFTVEGPDGQPLHVKGRFTLGENIADAGGLTASFQAWKRRVNAGEKDQSLPGLDYFTHEQLFFVNFANWFCGKSTKEAAINRIYVDPHAPKWARITGGMENTKEFMESFHCSKEPTCQLW